MVNCSYTKEEMHMWLIAGIFYCRDSAGFSVSASNKFSLT